LSSPAISVPGNGGLRYAKDASGRHCVTYMSSSAERACEEIESPHPEEATLLGGDLEGWQQALLSQRPSFETRR
jgi:hypothetical protein